MHILYIVMSTSLNIELNFDEDLNSITYKINNDKQGTLLDVTGKKSTFTDDLIEIMKSDTYKSFLDVYNAYKNKTSVYGRASSMIASNLGFTPRKNPATVTPVVDENPDFNSYAAAQNANDHIPKLGGKKSKSKRSYNANKTLKNRK